VSKSSVQETNPEPKLRLFSAMTPISLAAKQFNIVSYHTYGTNDWCYGVPRDVDGPSVPSHGTF
jgi:hypothetical protein